jgi:hypothetical protein
MASAITRRLIAIGTLEAFRNSALFTRHRTSGAHNVVLTFSGYHMNVVANDTNWLMFRRNWFENMTSFLELNYANVIY